MRGRKAKPLEGLNQYNFERLAKTSGNARERRGYLAFAHLQDGRTFTEAAMMVKVKLQTLMNWVHSFRKEGREGLKDRPGRGAKPHLSSESLEAFRQSVLELQASPHFSTCPWESLKHLFSRIPRGDSLEKVYKPIRREKLGISKKQFVQPSCRAGREMRVKLDKAITAFKQKADQQLENKTLPQPCRKPLESLNRHWDRFTTFVKHPKVPMDNNPAERGLTRISHQNGRKVGQSAFRESKKFSQGRFVNLSKRIFWIDRKTDASNFPRIW